MFVGFHEHETLTPWSTSSAPSNLTLWTSMGGGYTSMASVYVFMKHVWCLAARVRDRLVVSRIQLWIILYILCIWYQLTIFLQKDLLKWFDAPFKQTSKELSWLGVYCPHDRDETGRLVYESCQVEIHQNCTGKRGCGCWFWRTMVCFQIAVLTPEFAVSPHSSRWIIRSEMGLRFSHHQKNHRPFWRYLFFLGGGGWRKNSGVYISCL